MITVRRLPYQSGYVYFPVNSRKYRDTKEGGLFVKLFVVPNEDEYGIPVCCWTGCYDVVCEAYVGSDTGKRATYFFPKYNSQDEEDIIKKHTSIPLVASIFLGATGWSGWDSKNKRYFRAKYDDLDDVGKKLYDHLKRMYGKWCSLHIVTFLDT